MVAPPAAMAHVPTPPAVMKATIVISLTPPVLPATTVDVRLTALLRGVLLPHLIATMLVRELTAAVPITMGMAPLWVARVRRVIRAGTREAAPRVRRLTTRRPGQVRAARIIPATAAALPGLIRVAPPIIPAGAIAILPIRRRPGQLTKHLAARRQRPLITAVRAAGGA